MSGLMWDNFVPLWRELRLISDGLLLTGGYALYLKQRWLLSSPEIRTVVDLRSWIDTVPRATKDFDVIANIELIADISKNMNIAQIVEKQAFEVEESSKFWKFKKTLKGGNSLVLEFHPVPPRENREDIRVRTNRVKSRVRKPTGVIHGRENPEAAGSNTYPFSFNVDGLDIGIPNSVSLAVMKLSAMRDRWEKANDVSFGDEPREFHRRQAFKHAKDVFRTVAMMTMEESRNISEILENMKSFEVFRSASDIFKKFFIDGDTPGLMLVSSDWFGENMQEVLSVLKQWFKSEN